MADIRQNEIAQAQQNPGILSPLVGAQSPQPLRPPTQAFPSMQQAQQQVQSAVQPIASAGAAAAAPIATSNEQQLLALFNYDKQLEQGQSPFPQTPGYVENPADLYRGAAGYAAGTLGNLNSGMSVIQNINQAYTNAMNTVADKILQTYKDRAQMEREKRQDLINILSQTGGDYVDPDTGKTYHFPTPQEKLAAETTKTAATKQPLRPILTYIPGAGSTASVAAAPQNPLISKLSLGSPMTSAASANLKPTPGFVPDVPNKTALGSY